MSIDVLHQEDVGRDPASRSELGSPERMQLGESKLAIDSWTRLCRDFLRCHRRPLNVVLHLVTTPMSLLGFVMLLHAASPILSSFVVGVYALFLAFKVPVRALLASWVLLAVMLATSYSWQPDIWVAVFLLVVGYIVQELAHVLSGEATYQSTYMREAGWKVQLVEHTLLLLPVLFVVAGRRRQSPLRMLVARRAVLKTKLTSEQQCRDMTNIRDWVAVQCPELTQSTHWWQHDLSDAAGESFDRLANDATLIGMIRRFHGPGYEVKPVMGMNELYVTGPPKPSTSDTVFYRGHVDGPWAVFPGARLYRCMLATSQNRLVTTHFPMVGADYQEPLGYRLEDGDAVAFDFNRELHYITRDSSQRQTEPRVNLKLHYVAYPKALSFYGRLLDRLTTTYDIRARNLFLNTIDPNSVWQKLKTKWVLGWTKIFECVVRFVGWTNLAYVAALALISLAASDYRVFLAGTSFVHYLIYLGTFREREPVSFGEFKRDAVFYKSIALTQLFGVYAISWQGNVGSAALVAVGFGIATLATYRLGLRRTYFSAELGFDQPKRIGGFPYNWIPHPMVLGAMVGIGGMLVVPGIRDQYAWLIIIHLCMYSLVLIQEVTDRRWSKSTDARQLLG